MQKQKNQDRITLQDESAQPELEMESDPPQLVEELGGFKGPEPTRFGDWEKNGRCIDF